MSLGEPPQLGIRVVKLNMIKGCMSSVLVCATYDQRFIWDSRVLCAFARVVKEFLLQARTTIFKNIHSPFCTYWMPSRAYVYSTRGCECDLSHRRFISLELLNSSPSILSAKWLFDGSLLSHLHNSGIPKCFILSLILAFRLMELQELVQAASKC